jgi:hypothetical protein
VRKAHTRTCDACHSRRGVSSAGVSGRYARLLRRSASPPTCLGIGFTPARRAATGRRHFARCVHCRKHRKPGKTHRGAKRQMLPARRSVREATHGAMGRRCPNVAQRRPRRSAARRFPARAAAALARPAPTGLLGPCRGTAHLAPRRTGPRLNTPSFAWPVACCTFLIYCRFDAAPSCPPWGRSAAQQLWAPRQLLAAASIAPSAAC